MVRHRLRQDGTWPDCKAADDRTLTPTMLNVIVIVVNESVAFENEHLKTERSPDTVAESALHKRSEGDGCGFRQNDIANMPRQSRASLLESVLIFA